MHTYAIYPLCINLGVSQLPWWVHYSPAQSSSPRHQFDYLKGGMFWTTRSQWLERHSLVHLKKLKVCCDCCRCREDNSFPFVDWRPVAYKWHCHCCWLWYCDRFKKSTFCIPFAMEQEMKIFWFSIFVFLNVCFFLISNLCSSILCPSHSPAYILPSTFPSTVGAEANWLLPSVWCTNREVDWTRVADNFC